MSKWWDVKVEGDQSRCVDVEVDVDEEDVRVAVVGYDADSRPLITMRATLRRSLTRR